MDGGSVADRSQPAFEGTLGDDLEGLLDALARSGLKVGPRERVAAIALAASVTASRGSESGEGTIVRLADLIPLLAPLLARSSDERHSFNRVVAAYVPDYRRSILEPEPDRNLTDRQPEQRASHPWVWWLSVAVVVLLLGIVAVVVVPRLFPEPVPKPVASVPTSDPKTTVEKVAPKPAALAKVENKTIDRIVKAAERFEGAPTLEELAPGLAATSQIGWKPDAFTIRLHELTGLPTASPLGLYLNDGSILARLAHALDRIERPGLEGTLETVQPIAQAKAKALAPLASYVGTEVGLFTTAIISQLDRDFSTPYGVVSRMVAISGWPPDWAANKANAIARIQRYLHQQRTGRDEQPSGPDAIDPQTIERGLAITPPPVGRIFANPPWQLDRPKTGQTAPWWLPWLALVVPLVVAAVWLTNSLTLRKAFLRRRPPDLPPLHVDLIAEASGQVRYPIDLYRRIARRLQVRTSRPTGRIDPIATVAATLREGGKIVVPVYATVRHTPEYLVLIERRASGDQCAQRLRDLVARLQPLVPIAIYYFQGEPSVLEPESDGRPITIQRLHTLCPEHRLLILGSGTELLDPVTFEPHPAARILRQWTHRALLTPLPLAEWGREEIALANGLGLPIGRATPEGLLALAELIGRERTDGEDLVSTSGDGLARPLPEVFRVRPQRFLYSAPPSDTPVPEVLRHLRNLLDGPSFDWLAALAVYPAVQWDLTLHLGVTLPEDPKAPLPERGSPTARLYREDRIAALTQLPWLREGFMPAWLRRALIAELSPDRAASIRTALQTVLAAAKLSGDRLRDEEVKLRIAQQPAKDAVPPEELLEDEVLVDFLARGRIEDLAVPPGSILDRIFPKSWLDRFGLPELTSGLVALAYALAAFALSPRQPEGEALLTGAWLPLVVLALGTLFAYAVGFPREAYSAARANLVRLGQFGLTLGLVTACSIAAVITKLVTLAAPLYLFLYTAAAVATLQCVAHLVWRRILRVTSAGGSGNVSSFFTIASFVVAFVVAMVIGALPQQDVPAAAKFAFTISGALTGLGLLAHWFLPAALPPPSPAPKSRGRAWSLASGASAALIAMLPIAPAVWIASEVAASSVRLQGVAPGPVVVAETRDGRFVAIGGVDGIVHVYRRSLNGRIEAKPVARVPAATAGDQPATQTAATGAVVALDIRAVNERPDGTAADGPVHLLVETADGKVLMYDARGGASAALPDAMARSVSAAAPPRVALGDAARPLAAFETAEGGAQLIAADGSELSLDDSGIVTALVATGPGQYAIATYDGRVRLVRYELGRGLWLDRQSLPLLDGRARTLAFDLRERRLTAFAENGVRWTAQLNSAGEVTSAALETAREEWSLGAAIRWKGMSQLAAAFQAERVLKGHTGPVSSVAVTGDGARVVTGSDDRTVRIWGQVKAAANPQGDAAADPEKIVNLTAPPVAAAGPSQR